MLHITMPTSFEPALLDGLEELNARYAERGIQVTELYGSLPRSVMGVGRPTRSLAKVDRAAFEEHARDLRRRGFRLSYLFNGSCSANREFDPAERDRLLEEMRWVESLGTRSVVVASPYLIAMFRHHFPGLRVHVSSVSFAKTARTRLMAAVEQSRQRLLDEPSGDRNGGAAQASVAALRRRIDAIDDHVLELLVRRAGHAREIGASKRAAGLPRRDAERENGIVDRLSGRAELGGLDAAGVERIARGIVDECRRAASV